MNDLEQTAIERLKTASGFSLKLYKVPLLITYSGGKDSDVLLRLAEKSGIPFEVLHSLTTADAPETVYHVRDTLFARYPKYQQAYIAAFDRMLAEKQRRLGTQEDRLNAWKTGVDVFHWWMEDGVLPGQITMDDMEGQ